MSNPRIEITEGHVYSFKTTPTRERTAMVLSVKAGTVHAVWLLLDQSRLWNLSIEDANQKVLSDLTDDATGKEFIANLQKSPGKSFLQPALIPANSDYTGHPLSGWQAKLESNFTLLKKRKADANPNTALPIYALEHGLDEVEKTKLLQDLKTTFITREIQSGGPPLPWVVHASEVGLSFDGKEYWPMFEADFPGWKDHHRTDLAHLFHRFNDDFGGAMPIPGRWSDHFNRICLPITHSILPQLYQQKLSTCLAPLMRENRFFKHLFDDLELLRAIQSEGERIYPNDYFNLFLQGNRLIAEIVRRFFGDTDESIQIDDAAFEIVVRHLEETFERQDGGHARGPISDAIKIKRSLERLYQPKGLSVPCDVTNRDNAVHTAKALAELGITIELRNSSGGWDAEITIPCLEAWFSQMHGADEILDRTFIRVNGSESRSRRLRYIEHGSQTFQMHSWPERDQPLCIVDPPPGLNPEDIRHINRFLEFLSPNLNDLPVLFQLSDDRSRAVLIRSRKVRPGNTYILFGSNHSADVGLSGTGGDEEQINTKNIDATWLNVSANPSDQESEDLRNHGLIISRNLSIGPVGMMGLSQRESVFDWLVGQPLTVGFNADFPFDAVRIWDLEDPKTEIVIPSNVDNLTLMAMPTKATGVLVYGFEIDENGEVLEAGNLSIVVRDPAGVESWLDSPRHSLQVIIEPAQFKSDGIKLEDLWQMHVLVEVRGASNIPLNCSVKFFDNHDKPVGSEIELESITETPVQPEDWNKAFNHDIRASEDAARWYREAESIELMIDGGERGQFKRIFARRTILIRWKHEVSKDGGNLIYLEGDPDTSGLLVSRMDFKSPFTAVSVSHNTLFHGPIPAESGLYIAKWGNGESSSIVIPPLEKMDYAYLSSSDLLGASQDNWTATLDVVQGWELAPTEGNSDLEKYRARLLAFANDRMISSMLDPQWAEAETQLQRKGNEIKPQDGEWLPLLSTSGSKCIYDAAASSFENSVSVKITHFLDATIREKLISRKLSSEIQKIWKYQPYFDEDQTSNRVVAEFALRLVNAPETLSTWSRGSDREAMLEVEKHPDFLKAARLFGLLCNVQSYRWRMHTGEITKDDHIDLELFERWDWS